MDLVEAIILAVLACITIAAGLWDRWQRRQIAAEYQRLKQRADQRLKEGLDRQQRGPYR